MEIEEQVIEWKGMHFQVRRLLRDTSAREPWLVFLHDALGSIPQWKEFPNKLAAACGLNAVLIDRQGHGRSSPFHQERTNRYLHHEAWDVLPGLLDQLQITKPILIGHSDGGTIALLYAARYPVRAVVSIAAHVFVEEITRQSIRRAVDDRAELVGRLHKYHGEKTDTLFDAWADTWLSGDFANFNITAELSTLTAPLLLIQARDDEYGSLEQVEQIKRSVRSSLVETFLPEEGGHAPHLRDGVGVVGVVRVFWEKVGVLPS